jgi:hypothetical protein
MTIAMRVVAMLSVNTLKSDELEIDGRFELDIECCTRVEIVCKIETVHMF